VRSGVRVAGTMSRSCDMYRSRWASCRAKAMTCRFDAIQGAVTLAKLVDRYRTVYRPSARAELAYYGSLPTLAEAVRRAGRAERPDGKRHDHQTRIRRAALAEAGRRLEKLDLRSSRTFRALHDAVERAIGSIAGIGELMVYDTALRIGARLRLKPDVVYLHAGTRAGAMALGLEGGACYLEPVLLPAPLHRLRPHELEDFLCIFKDELARQIDLRAPGGRSERRWAQA